MLAAGSDKLPLFEVIIGDASPTLEFGHPLSLLISNSYGYDNYCAKFQDKALVGTRAFSIEFGIRT